MFLHHSLIYLKVLQHLPFAAHTCSRFLPLMSKPLNGLWQVLIKALASSKVAFWTTALSWYLWSFEWHLGVHSILADRQASAGKVRHNKLIWIYEAIFCTKLNNLFYRDFPCILPPQYLIINITTVYWHRVGYCHRQKHDGVVDDRRANPIIIISCHKRAKNCEVDE